jgi:ketosteroid isomerase-like protein
MPGRLVRATALAVAFIVPWQETALAQDASGTLLAAERALGQESDRRGLGRALLQVLGADAVILWPGAPVAPGPDARRLLAAQPALDSLRLTWQPLGFELSGDSTLAITWGVAVLTSRSEPAAPRVGRYIHAWQRDDGRWRLAAALLAGAPPAAGAVVPPGMPLRRTPLAAAGPVAPFVGADLAFAKLAGDSGAAAAFARWAAPGAVMVNGSGLLVRGSDAIGALVAGPEAWGWHPVAAGAAASQDLGWTVGEATIAPPGGATVHSKYLTVWRRLPDGSVRFVTDGGNPRPAP